MSRKLSLKELKGQLLQIERYKPSHTVIVKNIEITSFLDKEVLQIYFESNMHGCGQVSVECIEMLSNHRVKVTFNKSSGKYFHKYTHVQVCYHI